ncbi:TaqI-like C-terminal specificity domain-containing protein [Prevotella jejuni]
MRGRDIKRYSYEWANLWLIYIPWHFPYQFDESIQGASTKAEEAFKLQYPAVYSHLLQYKESLLKRNKAETGIRYEWYAMQRWGAKYWEDFSKPKIMYPNMTKYIPFYYDEKGFYQNDKSFMITGNFVAYLTAFLNSSLFKFCFLNNFPELQGGTRELRKIFFDKIPVLQVTKEINDSFISKINDIQEKYTTQKAMEIDAMLFELYRLTEEERKTIGFVEIT